MLVPTFGIFSRRIICSSSTACIIFCVYEIKFCIVRRKNNVIISNVLKYKRSGKQLR